MKEYNISLPPHLTECTVIIYTLPYYSGIAVVGGMLVDSSVRGSKARKNNRIQPGIIVRSNVEGTFKLIHEQARFNTILDSSSRFHVYYALRPETSGLVLPEKPVRLSARDLIRAGSGLVLESELVQPKIIRSLGRGSSSFVIKSDVTGTMKRSYIGDNRNSVGVLMSSEADFIPHVVIFPDEHGIIVNTGPSTFTPRKTTGAFEDIVLSIEADAVLMHSFGLIDPSIVITDQVLPVLKHIFTGDALESGIPFQSDVSEILQFSLFPYESSIELVQAPFLSLLKKTIDVKNSVVLDSYGDAILSHSTGKMESEMFLHNTVSRFNKMNFIGISGDIAITQDSLETHERDLFFAYDSMELSAYLKNLCYLVFIECEDNRLAIDSIGTVTPRKVLYGVEPHILLDSDADGSGRKAFGTENDVVLNSESEMTLKALALPEDNNIVITGENADASMKRHRLLKEIDDFTIGDEEIADMTLEELYYVNLT